MARWRPPQKPPSPYITAAGAAALKAELRQLWREVRPPVVEALAAAAAEGDRSENAEYSCRKKQLAGIDRRLRYLGKRLETIRIVDRPPADQETVRFGAWVRLRSEEGGCTSYRIVGADETDARKGWISIDSPMAAALLRKRAGERVVVELPGGRRRFEILEVRYPARD